MTDSPLSALDQVRDRTRIELAARDERIFQLEVDVANQHDEIMRLRAERDEARQSLVVFVEQQQAKANLIRSQHFGGES